MRESEKDIKIMFKRFWERWKGIRKEKSLFGKIYEIIFKITALIILGYMYYTFRTYELEKFLLIFLFLSIILILLSIINRSIYKKASKKYYAKVEKMRISICVYCKNKIDRFTSKCPYCGKALDDQHEKDYKVIDAPELESKFKKKASERGVLLSEQETIISHSGKATNLKFLSPIMVIISAFAIVEFFSLGIGAMISTFTGCFIMFLGYLLIAHFFKLGTIVSIFTISNQDIKLKIEKKIFYQINWADIKDIEVLKLSFDKGYFLKLNSLQKYKLIGLKFCDFFGSKQNKIIEAMLKYSGKLNKPISIKKAFGSFIDDVTMKELYHEIYNFARSQRFILKQGRYYY